MQVDFLIEIKKVLFIVIIIAILNNFNSMEYIVALWCCIFIKIQYEYNLNNNLNIKLWFVKFINIVFNDFNVKQFYYLWLHFLTRYLHIASKDIID